MVQRLLLIITVLALNACSGGGSGSSNTNNEVTICPRVINGQSCDDSGSPIVEIVSLSADGKESLCSGTAISADKVLTAAHCFAFTTIVKAVVKAGDNVVSVKKIFIHPGLAQTKNALFNDVAIIQTSKAHRAPTLPILLSQSVNSGDTVGINGYGLDEAGHLGALKGGSMKVNSVTVNHISATFNGGGSNTCNGDSGGPATETTAQGVGLVGLTSTGIKTDCGPGDVTLFTNLQSSDVLDFITSIVPDVGTI